MRYFVNLLANFCSNLDHRENRKLSVHFVEISELLQETVEQLCAYTFRSTFCAVHTRFSYEIVCFWRECSFK